MLLGLVTAALPYTVGIAAVAAARLAARVVRGAQRGRRRRRLGVVLLDEVPRPVQLVGGVLILAGVVAVKLGERSVRHGSAAARLS